MDRQEGWRKSSYSNGQGDCVEVGCKAEGVAVRDAKLAMSPVLAFTPDAWAAFTASLKN